MRRFHVRDVVDMDVALHGRRFIVIEFVLVGAFGAGLAMLETYLGLLRGGVAPTNAVTGIYATFLTLNCLTFALLAANAPRRQPPGTAAVWWLTAAALVLLAVPLLFPLAALLDQRSGSTRR